MDLNLEFKLEQVSCFEFFQIQKYLKVRIKTDLNLNLNWFELFWKKKNRNWAKTDFIWRPGRQLANGLAHLGREG